MRLPPRLVRLLLLTLILPLALAACGGDGYSGYSDTGAPSDSDDSSDRGDSSGDNARFAGTWALRQGTGPTEWYLIFNTDNTWLISDTPDGSARRVYGTYTVDGETAAGPMVNPGTGEGEIIATLDGNTLSLDFVEFWHDPHKHVAYLGTKI